MGKPYPEEKREKAQELYSQGMTRKQIAKEIEVSYGAVTRWLYNAHERDVSAGENADRHLCRTCCYRASKYSNGCDYLPITGKSRGCKAEHCDKYKKGKQIKRRARIEI